MEDIVKEYIENFFHSTGLEDVKIFSCIDQKVTKTQNQQLLLPITKEKFKDALFSMRPNKSPGIDGMNLTFFQSQWAIIGDDVTNYFT